MNEYHETVFGDGRGATFTHRLPRLNYELNNRGIPSINGQTLRTTTSDNNYRAGRQDAEDAAVLELERPAFDATVREIEREVEQMRLAGKLRPFVEGEPIGVLPRRVAPPKRNAEWYRKEHNARMERHRADMLAHRRKNDLILKELLG